MGKEPRAIIGTLIKDVVAQVIEDNRLKEKVQEAKDNLAKQKPPLVKKSNPTKDKAPNPQINRSIERGGMQRKQR
jgi:hypothetical protein